MFTGVFALCVAALVLRHHLNAKGCFMLFASAYGAWHFLGRLRVTLKHGDPTADFQSVEPE